MLHRLSRERRRQISLLIVGVAVALWAVVLAKQRPAAQVRRHIDQGMRFFQQRRPHDAEKEWLQAARLNPNDPGPWDLLAELYIQNEQWNLGMVALKHLEKVAPNRPYLYSRMAACALRMSNELEAQRLAQEELKRNPTDEASLTILAFLSNMQDNTEQQIGYLNRLLARSPDNVETLHALAQAYREAGKYPDALPIADRLVALRPQDGYGYAMRGAARFEVDASPSGLAKSENDLRRALSIEPGFAFARFALGRVYLREGLYPQAIDQLEQAEQLYPDKMDVPFELATAYARAGKPALAAEARRRFEILRQEATQVDVLQKQCALDHNNFAGFLRLGEIMLRNQDYRQAYYYLQHALVLNPKSAEAQAAYKELSAQLQNETAPAPH